MVTFNAFGEQISFHDDLKKYYLLQCWFQDKQRKTETLFKNSLIHEPTEIVDFLEKIYVDMIQKLIKRLSEYGVYDCTVGDFLNLNQGYLDMLQATVDYYQYQQNRQSVYDHATQAAMEPVEIEANSQIQGLSFGILSNNLLAHMIYTSQNDDKIREQTQQAQKQYAASRKEILSSAKCNYALESRTYQKHEYRPRVLKSITAFFAELLAHFAQRLQACGQMELSCLNGISMQRSLEILRNVSLVENTRALIIEALKVCPYNPEIYVMAHKEVLYPSSESLLEELGELINYFELNEALVPYLTSFETMKEQAAQLLRKYDYKSAQVEYKQISEIYPDKYEGWLGLFVCETEGLTKNSFMLDEIAQHFSSCVIDSATESTILSTLKSTQDQYEQCAKEKAEADTRSQLIEDEILSKKNLLYKQEIEGKISDPQQASKVSFVVGCMFALFTITALITHQQTGYLWIMCLIVSAVLYLVAAIKREISKRGKKDYDTLCSELLELEQKREACIQECKEENQKLMHEKENRAYMKFLE